MRMGTAPAGALPLYTAAKAGGGGRSRTPPSLPPKVSADGEVRLYEAATSAGITLLSIAHRPTLKRFHQTIVHFDGNVADGGRGWWWVPARHGGKGVAWRQPACSGQQCVRRSGLRL